MADASVRVVFSGSSGSATAAAKRVEGSFLSLGRVLKTVAGVAVGVAIVKGLKAAGQAAVDFDREMRNVNSIAKLSEKGFASLSKQVLALAGPTAKAPKDLAAGLYDIVSSGFKAGDAVKILAVTAKAATAGMTDTATATKGVVAILNAYHLSAGKAKDVSDILFQTVNKGVLTFEELAQNIGDTAPAAAALGIPFEQVAAGLATITLHGTNAAEASTQMGRVLQALFKPSEALADQFQKMGFESGQAAVKQLGLVGVIKALDKAAQGNTETLSDWLGDIRGIRGIINLTGRNLEQYTAILRSMDQATAGAGATQRAFAEQSKSLSFQWERAKQALTAAAIPIAQLLFPALVKGAQAVADFAGKVSAAAPQIKAGFAGFLEPIKAAVSGIIDTLRSLGHTVTSAFSAVGLTGLGGLFDDAASAGRTLGSVAVAAAAGLVTYKVAAIAASVATVGLARAIRATPFGLLLSLAVAAGVALGEITRGAENTDQAFSAAVAAINKYTGALKGLNDATAARRDANLQLEGSELAVRLAIQARNALLDGLSGKERKAAMATLEYQQAQLAVKQAFAERDRAEKALQAVIDQTTKHQTDAITASGQFKQALLDQIATLSKADAAFPGFARAALEPMIEIARKGSQEMRLWVAAAIDFIERTGELPTQLDIMMTLSDQDARGRLNRIMRELDIADKKTANPKVKVDEQPAVGPLRRVRQEVDKTDSRRAEPKVKISPTPALAALKAVATKTTDLDRQTATPTVNVRDNASRTLDSIRSKLFSLAGQTVTSTINVVTNNITRSIRRAGGGFIPGPDTGGQDAVTAMLAPGELVLNRPQQEALGGPSYLARLFGFNTAGVPGVQSFAGGGFVSRTSRRGRRRHGGGYKAKAREVARLQKALDANRDRQERLDRSISQDATEFDISVEEFLTVDADGNEHLDTAAVAKRMGEIDKLIARKNDLIGLIDRETEILAQLVEALQAAIEAYQAEIKDQQRIVREMTEAIRDATKAMNDTDDQAAKDSYQKKIEGFEKRRDKAREKISDLQGRISELKGDLPGVRRDIKDQPLDRRDVELDIQSLNAEKAEVAATKARPAEQTSAGAEQAATDAGAEGFGGETGGGVDGESEAQAQANAQLQATIEALTRQVSQLRLALGIEGAQLPLIGAFQKGTIHVPQTGLALVHAGETITPAAVAAARARAQGGDGGSVDEVLIRLVLDPDAEKWLDAKIIRAAPHVSVLIGKEADRRARAGEAGAFAAPARRLG